MIMNYATIDFKVTKDPNHVETYLVAATTNDRRTEQTSFRLKSTLWEDLDQLFKKLHIRTAQPDDRSKVQDYGKELYNAILQGPVRMLFDERYAYAETHQDSGLRLCLRILPPELISLPWEIMY